MQLTEFLEDFSKKTAASAPASDMTGAPEAHQALKLAAFEEGYQAGWEDATKAHANDSRSISSTLAENLQDLSFTYQEAVSHVVRATAPVLTQMVELILPELARQALGLQIVEQLQAHVDRAVKVPVVICVSDSSFQAVSGLLDRDFGFPIEVRPDSDLHPAQADLRFGDQETEIDLSQVLTGIDEIVQGLLFENNKVLANG